MTALILLTESEADAVRGPSATIDWASLEPVGLSDGRFVLPATVLYDEAHTAHHALLATLPTAESEDIEALLPTVENPAPARVRRSRFAD